MNGNLVHWSSTKCKRVTRSVLASEIYAMVHGVDMGIAIGSTVNMIATKLGIPKIPIIVCTDSFSLYECLVKLGTTKEKRLMIDIMSLRQSYEQRELFEIRWIHGQDNPADAMTKDGANRALQSFVDTNRLTLRVQGWVNRDRSKEDDQHQGWMGCMRVCGEKEDLPVFESFLTSHWCWPPSWLVIGVGHVLPPRKQSTQHHDWYPWYWLTSWLLVIAGSTNTMFSLRRISLFSHSNY